MPATRVKSLRKPRKKPAEIGPETGNSLEIIYFVVLLYNTVTVWFRGDKREDGAPWRWQSVRNFGWAHFRNCIESSGRLLSNHKVKRSLNDDGDDGDEEEPSRNSHTRKGCPLFCLLTSIDCLKSVNHIWALATTRGGPKGAVLEHVFCYLSSLQKVRSIVYKKCKMGLESAEPFPPNIVSN